MKTPLPNGYGNTVEVSLYDLIRKQFSGEINARTAEIELRKFHWEPFRKDGLGLSVVAFRTAIDHLLKRAGKTSQFERIRCIRNCLLSSMREKIEIVETEEKLWKKINAIHITLEVDKLDKNLFECKNCSKAGHSADVCKKDTKNTDKPRPITKKNGKSCTRCGRDGHPIGVCFSTKHRDGSTLMDPPKALKPDCYNSNSKNGKTDGAPTMATKPAPKTNTWMTNQTEQTISTSQSKLCYRCGAEGHIARDCKVTPTIPHAQISSPAKPDLVMYTMLTFIKKSFDEHDFPLFHILSQSYIENEVFTVPKIPVAEEVMKPTGCLWAISKTRKGQQMLTIWDTGAVVYVAPVSTMTQTKTTWSKGSDINFVIVDGVKRAPIEIAERFVFRIKNVYFAVHC